jgi:hypothetical protein
VKFTKKAQDQIGGMGLERHTIFFQKQAKIKNPGGRESAGVYDRINQSTTWVN